MTTTKVVRTRLQNRTVSYAVAKHNGHKVPKDFKEWTWKTALTFLNGKSKKAKLSRTDFEKVAGYPVPDGSFRDLITGRTAKSKIRFAKKSETSTTTTKKPKASKSSKNGKVVTVKKPIKDGIDYKRLAREILKAQASEKSEAEARASKEASDRYTSEMEIKRLGWSSQFKAEDKAIKPSHVWVKGEDQLPRGEELLKK
tara:strand:+ start:417 stop:1013 length:597 start_codon:yes stop_codon:yes gene_type:complete